MAASAIVLDVRTVAVGVAVRVAGLGAQVLDGRVRLLADPHEEHGFNGREVPRGLRVVAFGNALSIGAVEEVVAHDPAAAFAVGGFGQAAGGVGAGGPGGLEPGCVVGVLGEAGIPFVVDEGGVPCGAQVVHFVEGGGAGRPGAGGRVPGFAAGGVAGTVTGAGAGVTA